MLRFARFALTFMLLPAALAAQGSEAAAAAPSVSAARVASGPSVTAAAIAPDPWLTVSGRDQSRNARANIARLDLALADYRTSYDRLPPADRARVRGSYDGLIPGQSFATYRINEPQARAIAYLALGPSERPEHERVPRRARPGQCTQALDSMSREAAWIHSTAMTLGRSGSRRPREAERADVRGMAERARQILLQAPGCGCDASRDDAEALLTATREAVDVFEGSTMAAWMSLGSTRVQRIARLSDTIERSLLRCLSEGRD
jgi:hypothetical protein